MSAKLLDVIIGQPTTKSMDRMTEQRAKMVAPVKTTTWGGLHGSLALILDDADYATVTKNIVTSAAPLSKPTTINPKINKLSTPYEILTLQEEMKTLQKEFELQEAVTTIGVKRIIDSVEDQYIEELNKDYFGYANQTIKTLLTHLRTKWCKVMMKEHTDATEAFYQAWVPSTTHIITFGHQLDKQQKVQGHQRHHLGQSQNPPLCWANVQERLLHQTPNDQVQNEGQHQQDLVPYPTVLHQTFCPTQSIRR
jgi:hypothetical protein